MLGVWYPKDYIVASIDAAQGPAAVEALLAAGFGGNAVHLHDGARVSRSVAAIHEQRTPLRRAGATGDKTITDLS
jgi:galactokinase